MSLNFGFGLCWWILRIPLYLYFQFFGGFQARTEEMTAETGSANLSRRLRSSVCSSSICPRTRRPGLVASLEGLWTKSILNEIESIKFQKAPLPTFFFLLNCYSFISEPVVLCLTKVLLQAKKRISTSRSWRKGCTTVTILPRGPHDLCIYSSLTRPENIPHIQQRAVERGNVF